MRKLTSSRGTDSSPGYINESLQKNKTKKERKKEKTAVSE